jgi:beta-glucanase (GH16 family)
MILNFRGCFAVPLLAILLHISPFAAWADDAAAPGAATETENVNSPPISGELFDFAHPDLTQLDARNAKVQPSELEGQPAVEIDFASDAPYPQVNFPVPGGGWNLSAFGYVEVRMQNKGQSPIKAGLRVDNPGDDKTEPFDIEFCPLEPGETKTLRVKFGVKSNGSPSFPLDSKHVTRVQIVSYKPTAPGILVVTGLKASGSPMAGEGGPHFSLPSDRDKPVVVPDWVGQRPPVDGDWVQTLDSEFKGPTLDDKVWGTQLSWSGTLPDWTHRFSKDNLLFEDGVLKIKCERRTGHAYDDPTKLTRDYTTGIITTFNKWTQAYGYFEARIKLPTARGLWPVFWTMPDRGSGDRETTYNGGMEFDIEEYLTEWGPGRYNTAVHWDGYGKDHKSWANNQNYYGPTADGWHNWGLLWEPGKLTWYCDGLKKAEFKSPRIGSVPEELILDVQMGGWATKNVDQEHLPDYMQIAYVRAWQLRERLSSPPTP